MPENYLLSTLKNCYSSGYQKHC